jgi:hypothetical protein
VNGSAGTQKMVRSNYSNDICNYRVTLLRVGRPPGVVLICLAMSRTTNIDASALGLLVGQGFKLFAHCKCIIFTFSLAGLCSSARPSDFGTTSLRPSLNSTSGTQTMSGYHPSTA